MNLGDGNLHQLIQYLGNPYTTIVSGVRYIVPMPGTPPNQRISLDLLISFNAYPALDCQDNSYVFPRQDKSPEPAMEIASLRTGAIDVKDKPTRYAALGISEYSRYDETGEFHGTRLPGIRILRASTSRSQTRTGRRYTAGVQPHAEYT